MLDRVYKSNDVALAIACGAVHRGFWRRRKNLGKKRSRQGPQRRRIRSRTVEGAAGLQWCSDGSRRRCEVALRGRLCRKLLCLRLQRFLLLFLLPCRSSLGTHEIEWLQLWRP